MADDVETKELLKILIENMSKQHEPQVQMYGVNPPYPPQMPPQQHGMERANTALSVATHVKSYIGGFIAIIVGITMFYMDTTNQFKAHDARVTTLEKRQEKETQKYEDLEEDIEALHSSIITLRTELQRLDQRLNINRQSIQPNGYVLPHRSDIDIHRKKTEMGRRDRGKIVFVPVK